MFDGICDAIHREMDELEAKYAEGEKLNSKDLEDIDRMAHALKSMATYAAMKGEYDEEPYRGKTRTVYRYGYPREDRRRY